MDVSRAASIAARQSFVAVKEYFCLGLYPA
jgi:hypothetical protein